MARNAALKHGAEGARGGQSHPSDTELDGWRGARSHCRVVLLLIHFIPYSNIFTTIFDTSVSEATTRPNRGRAHERDGHRRNGAGPSNILEYDAFGVFGSIFAEHAWKSPIFA